MQVYLILALIFSFIVALFAIQNAGAVTIKFLFWTYPDISLVLIIIAAGAIGAIIMLLLGLSKQINKKRKIKELSNEINKLQAKLKEYENKDGNHQVNEEAVDPNQDTFSFKPPV